MLLHRTRIALGVATTLVALLLTGCADTAGQPRTASVAEETEAPATSRTPRSAAPAGSQSTRSPASAPSESSAPFASVSPAPATAPATAKKVALPDRLLTAEEMPGFNDHFTWRETGTRASEGPEPFGTCHRFAMTSIGAMRVVMREYAPAGSGDGNTAGHLVADFADEATARRAFEVLKSWRSQCAEQLSEYDRRDVGGLQTVDVPGGAGGWYLLTYGPPPGGTEDEAYFDAQGMTRVGKRISVLQMRLVGQDYNYPQGKEPMVEAVRTAGAELG